MKLDFDRIINNLRTKAMDLSADNGKVIELLRKTKKTVAENKELRSIVEDLKVMTELIKDYYSGSYKDLTNGSIVLVIIGLIYLVNPMDIIPDFLFGGFIDDAAVIAYILKKITTEIDAYKLWKSKRGTPKMDDDIIDIDELIVVDKDYEDSDDNMIDITPDNK